MNNKKPINLSKIKDFNSKKESLANEFCENCEILKKVLLELWKRSIKTTSCCAGHIGGDGFPYLALELKESRPQIKDLGKLLSTLTRDFNEKILISYHNNSIVISFYPKNTDVSLIKARDNFFNIIYNCISNFSKVLDTSPIKEYRDKLFSLIKEIFDYEGIYNIYYNKNKYYIYENGKRKNVLNETQIRDKFRNYYQLLDDLKSEKFNRCTIKQKNKKK